MFDGTRYETCSVLDPAIDVGRSRFDKFLLTRDMEHLVFTDGKAPTVYELRRPPERVVRTYVRMGDIDSLDLCVRAFKASLVRVKNFTDTSGVHYDAFEPMWARSPSGLFDVMSEEECDMFPTEMVMDIGGVAYQRCFLDPKKSHLYRASLTSQRALDLKILSHLRAEEILATLDQSNDACKARLADLLVRLGAPDGAATAKAKSEEPETAEQTCEASSTTSAA